MPLHDWSELAGWDGVHHLWTSELLRHLKSRLPPGYRAYLGAGPALTVGAPAARPDVAVRAHPQSASQPANASVAAAGMEPDDEVAVATLESPPTLLIEKDKRLIAAVELVSPRNKDRPVARTTYLGRYVGYLIEGVHLLLVDVHRRPAGFSFADQIAAELQVPSQPLLPAPFAVSYRVGEPAATGGRLLAFWRRPLVMNAPLPEIPLPLDIDLSVPVDLEATYMLAAADAYLA